MVDDRQAERARVGERRPQDRGGPHRRSVVRETHHARIGQLAQRRQPLPSPPDRHRPVGEQLDRRARGNGGRTDLGQDPRLVESRRRVRHRADGREPAVGGGGQPGRHRLGVLVAGFAQMGVEIDEPGRDDDPVGVDPLRVGTGEPGDRLEDPVPDDDLARAFPSRRGIDQPGAADLEIRARTAHAAPGPAGCVPASR